MPDREAISNQDAATNVAWRVPIEARVELELRPATSGDGKPVLLELREMGRLKQFPDPYAGAVDTGDRAVLVRLTRHEAMELGRRLLEAGRET